MADQGQDAFEDEIAEIRQQAAEASANHLPHSGGAFSSSMPYANLATAGEGVHNANAVRTAKKNESRGRRPLGDGSTQLP